MADRLAIFETTKGTVTVKLDETAASDVIHNFVELAEKGFYNALTFTVYDGMGAAIAGANATSEQAAAALIFLYSDSTSLHFTIRLAAAPDLKTVNTHPVVFGGVSSSSDIVNALGPGDRLLKVIIEK